MTFLENIDERLPEQVQDRLRQLRDEVYAIGERAKEQFVTEVPRMRSFRVSGESNPEWGDLMPPEERAQAVSFIVRYDHLPEDVKVHIGKADDGWRINNIWELRHILNEIRPIIQNQNDLTFYTNVNATIQKRLRRSSLKEGLMLQVYEGDSDVEVTAAYASYLGENTKAIAAILSACEYGYLYNGILQHSDPTHAKRFLHDYTSGELNYILWKHVSLLGQIRWWLRDYYHVLKLLNFPSMGSLLTT